MSINSWISICRLWDEILVEEFEGIGGTWGKRQEGFEEIDAPR